MSESDVKMEDAEKFHDESGNNIQESECKLIGDKVECQEEVPLGAAALGDVNGGENGGDDLNKVMNEDKDKMDVKTVVEDQTKPVNEASEPIEGSECGIAISESVNKELISTETPVEAQVTATSGVEKQGSVENEVFEHDATNSGVKEDEPAKNNMVDADHGKNVEERPNEDLVEKLEGIAAEAQIAATSEVEKQGDVRNKVVEHDGTNSGAKEDEPAKNHVVEGNHESVVEERPSEDLVDKPEQIDKDTCDTEHVAGETMMKDSDAGNVPSQDRQLITEFPAIKDPQGQDAELDDVRPGEDEEMKDAVHVDQDKMVKEEEQGAESFLVSHENDGNEKSFDTAAKPDTEESSLTNQQEPFTPNSLVRCSSAKNADHSGETAVTAVTQAALPFMGEDDEGIPEEQAEFMKELDHFYRERTVDFKPPKFYGQPLNCLKLWRAVIRLGGYDRVTGSKLWRQVGESFHPPKTCTTVSWTFRIFYEKSLLEYERHKTQSGELQLPTVMLPEVSGADVEGNGYQGSGSGPGRARRDAAARAMQGWHAQRLLGTGEVGEPTIKDKNLNNLAKNEKNLKSIGSLKQKRPNEVEHSNKAARTDTSKQLVPSVVDVGPPADWVKINVRQTKDCFEVYALVPGLLREEVRVQSDPAGRLVITGQPEQVDNPWGITPFKKVISLPARIHPVQTSAVVSLHGRLFVRVPFEQPSV